MLILEKSKEVLDMLRESLIKEVVEGIIESFKYSSLNYSSYESNFITAFVVDVSFKRGIIKEINLDKIFETHNLEDLIRDLQMEIERNVPELKGVFEALGSFYSEDRIFVEVLYKIQQCFNTSEELSVAFNHVLEILNNYSGKVGGENETVNCLSKLSTMIIEPKNGSFYDLAFGSGGTALEAYNYAKSYGNHLKIFGQEINRKQWAIAKIRMFINGIEDADIRCGDTLVEPLFLEKRCETEKFDYIISNPPFSLSWKEIEYKVKEDPYGMFAYGLPSVSSADWLFILAALRSLNETGKAAIITTLGALTRGGAEQRLRERVLNFDYIEAVINLAGNLFSHTAIPCSIIIFNKNKEEHMKGKIKFIEASHIYTSQRRGKNFLSDENINKILEAYRSERDLDGVSKTIGLEGIKDSNISPSRYVFKSEFESEEFGKVKIDLDKLELTEKIKNIGKTFRGINITNKTVLDPNGEFKIINVSDVKGNEVNIDEVPNYRIENNARVEAYRVEPGDLIISSRGATKVAIIPENSENLLISQNFIGLRLNHENDPEYIKELLLSPIGRYFIDRIKTGTVVQVINQKDFDEMPLVCFDHEEQKKIMKEYKEEERELNKQIEELQRKLENMKLNLYEKMKIKDGFEIL
ncbi:N-6 DNA methylase [Clostridium perfringens]|nr:N-6 DNA methylase [Clostridium perfringens]MDZ5012241.1 N-6 DNA methylase [Clostridium perfringens]